MTHIRMIVLAGLFPAILGKGPWPKLGKMIDLTAKLGEMDPLETRIGAAFKGPVQLASCLENMHIYLPVHMRKYTMISLFALVQESHFSVYKILDPFSLLRAVYHLIYSTL